MHSAKNQLRRNCSFTIFYCRCLLLVNWRIGFYKLRKKFWKELNNSVRTRSTIRLEETVFGFGFLNLTKKIMHFSKVKLALIFLMHLWFDVIRIVTFVTLLSTCTGCTGYNWMLHGHALPLQRLSNFCSLALGIRNLGNNKITKYDECEHFFFPVHFSVFQRMIFWILVFLFTYLYSNFIIILLVFVIPYIH